MPGEYLIDCLRCLHTALDNARKDALLMRTNITLASANKEAMSYLELGAMISVRVRDVVQVMPDASFLIPIVT